MHNGIMGRSFLVIVAFLALMPRSSPADDDVSVKGDFRMRYEVSDRNTQPDGDEPADRQRLRIRMRVLGSWLANPEWTIVARIVTGSAADDRSPHHTLEGFDGLEVSLDRAFAQFRRGSFTGRFGKVGHPFKQLSVYRELLWDEDVGAQGITAALERGRLFGHAVLYIVDEEANRRDLRMYALQAGASTKGSNPIVIAVSFYGVDDLRGTLSEPFNVVDAQVRATAVLGDSPSGNKVTLSLTGQFISNVEADEDGSGFAVGGALNLGRRVSRIYAQWQRLDAYSVPPFLGQDDFLSRFHFEGLVTGVVAGLAESTSLHLFALTSKSLDPGASTEVRYRGDVNIRF